MIEHSMPANSIELNAYRYWMVCKCLDHWSDTATLVLCHLLLSPHARLKARAQDLCRRVQAGKNDGIEIYEEEPEPA